ncbi:MAG: UPF0175 family protein [Candidatus Bipolaricaulia bacterium]
MPTLEIEIPKQTLDHLDMAPEEFAFTMRAMTALKMYELGQIPSQEAADLAGVSRIEFLQLLRRHQVPPFEWLDETGAPTRPVGEFSDAEVLRLSNLQMPAWQSQRLHELLDKQRESELTADEQSELEHLLQLNDSALLLKSEAVVEAVRRGLREPGTSQ